MLPGHGGNLTKHCCFNRSFFRRNIVNSANLSVLSNKWGVYREPYVRCAGNQNPLSLSFNVGRHLTSRFMLRGKLYSCLWAISLGIISFNINTTSIVFNRFSTELNLPFIHKTEAAKAPKIMHVSVCFFIHSISIPPIS